MPANFDRCEKLGGKIRTISGPNEEHGLKAGEYIHYCILPKGGSVRGEIKTVKKPEVFDNVKGK
jgi:hypothetical protein